MPDVPSTARFITSVQVTRDLLNVITANTDPTVAQVVNTLKRESVCDFKNELITNLGSDAGTGLAQHIRTFVRDNTGENTSLKAAERLYLNANEVDLNRSTQVHNRTTAQLTRPLLFSHQREVVRDKATLGKCYILNGNVLTFTRQARIAVVSHLNWGVWSGVGSLDSPPAAPSWRFDNSGSSRTVTASLNYLIAGSLTQGVVVRKLKPQTTVFYEEEVLSGIGRGLCSSTIFEVFNAQDPQGRIESLTFEIERSPYVVSFGTLTDGVGFFKTTPAGSEDLSNFIEIIEL